MCLFLCYCLTLRIRRFGVKTHNEGRIFALYSTAFVSFEAGKEREGQPSGHNGGAEDILPSINYALIECLWKECIGFLWIRELFVLSDCSICYFRITMFLIWFLAAQISQIHTLQMFKYRQINRQQTIVIEFSWLVSCFCWLLFTGVARRFAFATAEFSNNVEFSALICTFFKNQRTLALFFLLKVGTAYEKLSPNLDFSIYYVCIVCVGYIPKFPE